jgi:transforming growth factor-beta-induced protein
MKSFALKFSSVAIAATMLVSTGCNKEEDDTTPPAPQSQTIAQIASNNADFSILVDALTRTNLVDAVNDANADLTVFAPTNAAFGDLLTELGLADLDAAEAALGTAGLRTVLLYHVLGMEVKSNMVSTGYAKTLAVDAASNMLNIYISTASGSVKINDRAMVTTPDVDASNGVIHIINKVILPLSVYELLAVNPEFSSLTTALGVADGDLDALLSGPSNGPFTVFAPDDMAFSDALSELMLTDLTALVGALGTDGVADVLTYHVVPGTYTSSNVPSGAVTTANGDDITISLMGGVSITDANNRISTVKAVDIQGTNGVIHVINKVLLP